MSGSAGKRRYRLAWP